MKNLSIVLLTLALVNLAQADEAATGATATASRPEWDSNAELSLLLTSGNTDIRTIGLGAATIYKPLPWVLSGKAAFLNSSTSSS